MTSTPRTDAVAYDAGGNQHADGAIVPAEFARALECELAERKRVGDTLVEFVDKILYPDGTSFDAAMILDALKAWRALP